jgi:hypothetical protein
MTQPTLTIDREKRQIIMTRFFEAPRELVFKTYIDPKLIRGMATLRAKLGHSLNLTFSDRIPMLRNRSRRYDPTWHRWLKCCLAAL